MEEARIVEEIIGLLEARGVKVRREHLGDSTGGLCKVKGETILFLDMKSHPDNRAAVCIEALLKMVDIDKIYLRPQVRNFIEQHTKSAGKQEVP